MKCLAIKKLFCFLVCLIALSIFVSNVHAGIVLKVLAANPSKAEKQKVQVKAYLPKEIKPEDVVDKGDLEIAYDSQQGSYYVYGEYELAPGQVIEKDVEMHDIWNIPPGEMESIRAEAAKTSKLLENTDFKERMNFIKESIESKLREVEERQKVPAANPERHISNYRDNLKLLESVKADLVVLRSLLAQAKIVPPTVIWRLVIIIIVFLGFIGGGSYLIWQKQSKVITTPTFTNERKEEEPQVKGEKKGAKEKKSSMAEDIEKIISEEDNNT